MKILNIEWEAFGLEDIKDAFAAEGYDVSGFLFSKHENAVDNLEMEKRFRSVLYKEVPDVVFSFDYYPVFSKVCQQEHIRYISWVYDNPQILLYSDMVVNPCNVIFVFDKKIYQEFHDSGIKTVHYMPLAVNTERLDHMTLDAQSCKYDISFVGSLYLEELSYFERMSIRLSDYAKGYLDSLMAAQMRIQGYNFYAHYVIDRKITSDERIELLSAIARQHRVDLFTLSKEFQLPNVYNHGAVDPYTGAPFVYKQSRINLNITLRSIERGIPLRAFDIMGAGGFLISNFQADFLDYFVPGEDFIYYEDKEDLLKKIDYYLDHEQERKIIAKNGHDKVAAGHTFRHRVREMFAQV